MEQRKRIAFLHPDLGLGGAERLVVDAAVELSRNNYQVDVFTAFHDPKRSFRETVDGPFSVAVRGGWFPRNVFGKAHAFCAYMRCLLVAISIAWVSYRKKQQYDVIIVDQVSAVIPVLHWLTSSKVLFYCHHPDLLLAIRRPGLHRHYRKLIDRIEELTTGQADRIVFNSEYTADVFARTFPRLSSRDRLILHPACRVPSDEQLETNQQSQLPPDLLTFCSGGPTFLSINRFERKKDVGLAIRALSEVLAKSSPDGGGVRLVIAGGFDKRLAENREYLAELQELASELGVQDRVRFLPSFSDEQRAALLAASVALLYTPVNEHFGIVPLEAMAAGRPVIACNSGGPRESVLHGRTGFLCKPTSASFAAAMRTILEDGERKKALGSAARTHVSKNFSLPAFGSKLRCIMNEM